MSPLRPEGPTEGRVMQAQPDRPDHARQGALRRHRRRLGRRRRHGRVPARHVGHQGAPARGRAHARPAEGIQDDGVAVQGHAPPPAAGGGVRAVGGRVPHARPALRPHARDAEVQEGDGLLGQSLHARVDRQREGAPDHRHAVRVGARPRARRQDEPVGARLAALLGTRPQGEDATTASARTGRSATPTSRPTTTRSTRCSASRGRRRTSRTCPTASSSAR